MFKMSKEERNCAFEGGGRGHRNGKEMEGGRRVFQTEATTVCYMLLTTTHQTVDTDDDLREALLSLLGQEAELWRLEISWLAVSFPLLIHPGPLRGSHHSRLFVGKPSRAAKGVDDGWPERFLIHSN